MSVRARVPLAFLLALGLLVSACAGDGETPASVDPTTGGGATGPSTVTQGPPASVPEVLDFEAPLLGGGSLKGADLAGKDVAFWFWAPW